jgi:hypothetical protein
MEGVFIGNTQINFNTLIMKFVFLLKMAQAQRFASFGIHILKKLFRMK